MTAVERQGLDELGYVVLPAQRAVPADILVHLETLFEGAGENAGHSHRVDPFARSLDFLPHEAEAFAPFTSDAAALGCVEHRLGPGFKLAALRARSLNPFALALDPPPIHPRPSICQVLWLLDDFEAQGAAAIYLIPGSHLVSAPRGVLFDELAAVAVTAGAGSAIVLDGRLSLASASNPGNRHLRTLLCEYVGR